MSVPAIMALPDEMIDRVVLFKRDDIRNFRVSCEVWSGGVVFHAYEDAPEWDILIKRLERLPGFLMDWSATLSEPPYNRFEMVAYTRPSGFIGG